MSKEFQIKDSGKREQYASGMVRDTSEGKIDYTLVLDGPMFKRWAIHLTKGAKKYSKRNWMKARGEPELERFRESALRHFLQWFWGDVDEDHASAVVFNINSAEYVKEILANEKNIQMVKKAISTRANRTGKRVNVLSTRRATRRNTKNS